MTLLDRILGPRRFDTVSPWGPLAACATTIGLGIGSIIGLFALLAALYFALPGWGENLLQCVHTARTAPSASCAGWLLGFSGLWGVVLAAGFYFLSRSDPNGSPATVLLLRRPHLSWWQYAAILVGMLACLYLVEIVLSLVSGATEADLERGIEPIKALTAAGGTWSWVLLVFVVAVAAPLSEEFAFRGFLLTALINTRLGLWGTAIVTSAGWTLLHYSYTWQLLLALFVFGILLTYIVWRTGSVWTGIFVHAVNNFISVVLLPLR